MHSHDNTSRWLATGLAALAGFVDAIGFINLGGFFVSFMSGNSTRFAVGLADHLPWTSALVPPGIIALFVIGVILGYAVRRLSKTRPSTIVLTMMSILLFMAAVAGNLQLDIAAVVLMALAMGTANNVFVREGEVSIGVTYMTGTLVKFGQRVAERLLGAKESRWLPYFLLWLGLVAGACLGAFAYTEIGLSALWLAALFCSVLTIAAARMELNKPA